MTDYRWSDRCRRFLSEFGARVQAMPLLTPVYQRGYSLPDSRAQQKPGYTYFQLRYPLPFFDKLAALIASITVIMPARHIMLSLADID